MTNFNMPNNVSSMKYALKSVPGLADVWVPHGVEDGPRTLVPRFKGGGAIQIGIIGAGKQKKRYTLIKQTNNNVQCIW